ncbi:MAG: pseudouridine synthase [Patescibacteria group bacterium]|jgi:23S rRNA pseudouridine2605 synthase
MTSERLNKYLAQVGIAARRKVDALIAAGAVRVNGRVAILGQRVIPGTDRITVDGRSIEHVLPTRVVLAYYKPRGVMTTASDDLGRTTIYADLPTEARLYPVGRLDQASEGLLLVTNDGDLALRLTHPRYAHEKRYRVSVDGLASRTPAQLVQALAEPRILGGKRRQFDQVQYVGRENGLRQFEVVVHEGLKHIVRRLVDAAGLTTLRLVRIAHGPIKLGDLKPGNWRPLTEEELAALEPQRSVE